MVENNNRILHIITGLDDGGAEAVLYRLCIQHPSKHQVISLMDAGKYGALLKRHNIPVYELNLNPSKPNPYKLFELYSLIKKINPSIVQTWMYHADLLGGIASKAAGVTKVFWGIRHSNLSKGTIKPTTRVVMKSCALLSYTIPTKIISCSKAALNSHIPQGYTADKFEVVQNGYDLTKFKPLTDSIKRLELSSGTKPIIGMVARFDVQKDHKNLINALSILKNKNIDFHLILVGKGVDHNNSELIQLINESSLIVDKDITLYGQSNNIPLIMSSIDLHVLSSLGEAFPNVLAEAMACGTPCVSTNVGDAKEIVSNYGWVVETQNPVLLAKAIEAALKEFGSDSPKWQSRKKGGINHIRDNFDLNSMIENFFRIWGIE